MSAQTEANKQLALEFLEAYSTFDPAQYEKYLADDTTYRIGNNIYKGKEGFAQVAHFGRTLYPHGLAEREILMMVAEDDIVAVQMIVHATTNKGEPYENIYAVFLRIVDGKIALQTELLDFRYAAERFDLSAVH